MLLKLYITLTVYLIFVQPVLSQQSESDQKVSHGIIGFTTIRKTDKDGNPLLISIWYPAEKGAIKMSLEDYITANKLIPDTPDTIVINEFRKMLELPSLFHLDKIPDADFKKTLHSPFAAYKGASMKKGKFPLVIAVARPDAYTETFEFLAGHGFVVAAVTAKWKDEQNDTLLYVNATNILEGLLNFMMRQSYVDTSNIKAFGHGGGIQPAFYLAMRTPKIKQLVNLDGGVFGLRSKAILSPDYKPSALNIPMLHIITQAQRKEDDQAEFNALSNPRYRVVIKSDSMRHHDFTMWGRVVATGLHKRGTSTALINRIFVNINTIILYFLKNRRLDSSVVDRNLFQFEKF